MFINRSFKFKQKHVIFFIILFTTPCLAFSANENIFYSVRDYGAEGNGKSLDTKAIQKTIDACSKAGGGTVYFPAGTYLSGTIFFKNNISLYLDAGATLLGSTDDADYPVTICEYRSYTDNYTEKSLIYAEKVKNISILGRGTIDGQGEAFKQRRSKENPYKLRPYMIRMIQCQDVTIRDVTIVNSPMWVQHYLACDDVLIDGITVDSFVAGNNDGIDIDSCHKVRISNCDIFSGDDAIVLKATSDRACENITVTNCVLSTHCNAFKLGTESNGGFKNITFSNSTIYDTRLAAIALEMVDGGVLQRVNINNISISNSGTAIFLRLGNRARPFLSEGPGGSRGDWKRAEGLKRPGMGALHGVNISNIIATGISKVGCSITGIPNHPVKDVTLQNIRISYDGGGSEDLITRSIPENEDRYPEFSMFGDLPSYGFFVRHVEDIKFDNMELEYEEQDARPAFVFDDVKDLDLLDIDGELSPSAPAFLMMENVNGAFIHGSKPTRSMDTFIHAEKSNGIAVLNNVFTNVKNIIQKGADSQNEDIKIQ